MKKYVPLLTFLIFLSVIIGYLFSKISWVGRMALLFKAFASYRFLEVWWQGALLIMGVFLLLLLVQGAINRFFSRGNATVMHILFIVIAVWGLYATYNDFQHVFAHRVLRERFHLGGYLFWFGWIVISLFCIRLRPTPPPIMHDLP